MGESYELERFVEAQDAGGTYETALAELRRGRKASHWMWFVFPQLAGLGHSPMAQRFGIASLGEATAYLAHAVLGPRLVESARVVLGIEDKTAEEIFGAVDALKLRSSMTLFSLADPGEPVFGQVLDKYYGGEGDPATSERLS